MEGVGPLTALVLDGTGDLHRFSNRRQIGAYLGLVPSCHESGSRNDCKGHITRQGSKHVRRALCQASWGGFEARRRTSCGRRLVRKNPKHKKIAVVAVMRRLGVRMWREDSSNRAGEATPWGEVRRADATGSSLGKGLRRGDRSALPSWYSQGEMVFMDKRSLNCWCSFENATGLRPGLTARRRV